MRKVVVVILIALLLMGILSVVGCNSGKTEGGYQQDVNNQDSTNGDTGNRSSEEDHHECDCPS